MTTRDDSAIGDGAIEATILARPRDIDGFPVRRALPYLRRRSVGPFVFLDQMGPTSLPAGAGLDVRPHPHIGLATVTYLFDGEILHRDSLGSERVIRPGDVNWMIAGRGITHSERSPSADRERGVRLHGIQSWVALPVDHEEMEPRFEHHPAASLPTIALPSVTIDVIAGSALGARSPVSVFSPTLYAQVRFAASGRLDVDAEHEERAVYVVEGAVRVAGQLAEAGALLVLRSGDEIGVTSEGPARLMLLGGARLPEPRSMDWNFVSSRPERLAGARDDWEAGRFPTIPGDDSERAPYPTR